MARDTAANDEARLTESVGEPVKVAYAERVEVASIDLDDVALIVLAMPNASAAPELSPAEQEVVQLALDGCSNREIAERRGASVKTVANQLRAVYRKLGINSRFELAARLGG